MVRWVLVVAMTTSVWADPAVQIGPRAGVELRGGADPSAGVELRLGFSRSPLTINPGFDAVFDAQLALYRLTVNALCHVPVPIAHVEPYVGIGVIVTSFSYKAQDPSVADDNGTRMGMNLVAGTSFVLPGVSPFLQVAKGFGEFTAWSIGGGVSIALGGAR